MLLPTRTRLLLSCYMALFFLLRITRGAEKDYALVGPEIVDQDEPLPPIKGQRRTREKRAATKKTTQMRHGVILVA